jgi:uncharacterized membrane protein YgdD (TMEM256/DUF423 family)
MKMSRRIILAGLIFIVLSIILGAFGAHALKEVLAPEKLISFETGVRYQMYHGLALLIVGLNEDKFKSNLKWFYNLIIIGVVLFSFSIYFLAIQDVIDVKLKFLGPITPFGGLMLISGWIVLLIKVLKK